MTIIQRHLKLNENRKGKTGSHELSIAAEAARLLIKSQDDI